MTHMTARATPRPAKGSAAQSVRARRNAKARHWRHVCQVVDARDLRCCRACGFFTAFVEHHHIVLRARGGEDTPDNVISLCWRCHRDVHEARMYVSGSSSALAIRMRVA